MENLEQFVDLAHGEFGFNPADAGEEENYIRVPTDYTRDQLRRGDPQSRRNLDPLLFLTGIPTSKDESYFDQEVALPPSLSIVVGEYGVGKTELMKQIATRVSRKQPADPMILALPVRLATCHLHPLLKKLRSRPLLPAEMRSFLFDHLFATLNLALSNACLENELTGAIRQGRILLLLDGVDELIFDPKSHRNFFASLFAMWRPEHEAAVALRVVVSMRLEYFLSFDDPDGEMPLLAAEIPRDEIQRPLVNLYFLKLNLFKGRDIESYLANHQKRAGDSSLQTVKALFESLKSVPKVLETLQRPLLLRIFTELINDRPELLANINDYQEAWLLIQVYIDTLLADKLVNDQQQEISPLKWKIEKFPEKCLELYREGEDAFNFKQDLSSIVEFSKNTSDSEKLEQIHKCPVFQRTGATVLRFAHRAFLEYFTVRGMVEELDQRAESGKSAHESAFDELVLNVDMRKFLRSAINERTKRGGRDWFDETRRSYGLEEKDAWQLPIGFGSPTLFEELEKHRRILLDLMTDPQTNINSLNSRQSAEWFMGIESLKLHPGYLRFNYEAVAVLLREQRWNDEFANLRLIFEKKLCDRLREVIELLLQNQLGQFPWERRDLELLFERILSIGIRLRHPWTIDADSRRRIKSVVQLVKNSPARSRLKNLLDEHGLWRGK